MSTLVISVGLLFAIGFAAGYGSRALISIARRSKQRKQRLVHVPIGDVKSPGAAAAQPQAATVVQMVANA